MNKYCLLLLSSLLLFLISSHVFAEKYHGEFCWQVFNQSGEPYWKYKFGVYEKEGGHFALFGSVDYENTLSASHGNAILAGEFIKLTIVSTDHEEGNELWAETFAAKLIPATLDGTWNALELVQRDNDNENDVSALRQRGSIKLITCQ